MDAATIIKSEANISLLNQVLLKPYQMKILSHFKKAESDETFLTKEIPIDEAVNQLQKSLNDLEKDKISHRVDKYICELITSNDEGGVGLREGKQLEDPSTHPLGAESRPKK